MPQLNNYRWEGTLVMIIGCVIVFLTLVTHLTARTDALDRKSVSSIAPPPPTAVSQKRAMKSSDPLDVMIGPSAISGEYKLLAATRTPATPTSDKLTLRIRVVSHAAADLVTPFQSTMLEVQSPGLEPINPEHPFSHPIQAGNSREEDIVFIVPASLDLNRAALRIHYYADEKEVPLSNRVGVHHVNKQRTPDPAPAADQ